MHMKSQVALAKTAEVGSHCRTIHQHIYACTQYVIHQTQPVSGLGQHCLCLPSQQSAVHNVSRCLAAASSATIVRLNATAILKGVMKHCELCLLDVIHTYTLLVYSHEQLTTILVKITLST